MGLKTVLMGFPHESAVGSLIPLFNGLGYRTETAGAISELIRRVRSRDIHVLLLEDEIEGVKAYDLVPVFKRINGRIQIIVVSSDSALGPARRLRESGIFYQAMKPVDAEELTSAVGCAFEKIERENLNRELVLPSTPLSVNAVFS